MFAARESVQESLGFSPFNLVFGHLVRGPLKLLKEQWLNDDDDSVKVNLLDYVSKFRIRLHEAGEIAKKNLENSQQKMKMYMDYDRNVKARKYEPGDEVLVLSPLRGKPLQAKYNGPYKVLKEVNDLDYIVETLDRRKPSQLCCINMLKTYYSRDNNTVGVGMCKAHGDTSMIDRVACDKSLTEKDVPSDDTAACQDTSGMEDIGILETPVKIKLSNSEVIANIDSKLEGLSVEQKQQLKYLIQQYESIFPDVPNRTNAAVHDIDLGDSKPIKQHPYRVGPVKMKQMKEEIDYMLVHDIIKLSNSEWSSPCVLVPKPDGSIRFCTDYRKVIAFTKGGTYPLARILDCIDGVGNAKYVTKIDLLKGYWCLPLTKRARVQYNCTWLLY